MEGRLGGKTAVVTGAANGIGRAIAVAFAEAGARVFIVDFDVEAGDAVSCQLQDRGFESHFIAADVTDRDAVFRMARMVEREAGVIDALVNNAGRDVCTDFLTMEESDWRFCFAVNLESALYCCQAILPHMIRRKAGSIVNIASVQALKIIRGAFPYPVAKHALLALTKCLAVEYAGKGIRVNSICPGPIETDLVRENLEKMADPEEARKAIASRIPCGRHGTPAEVAMAALFLVSDDSSYVNAANLVVDGGREVMYW